MIKWIDNLAQKVKHGIGISLNEGFEILRRKQSHLKEVRKAQDERKEFQTQGKEVIPEQAQQRKYLDYALSLIEIEQPFYYKILALRMEGMKIRQIAKELSIRLKSDITVAQVSKQEALAVRCVKEKIDYVRRTGIPIFEKTANSVIVN